MRAAMFAVVLVVIAASFGCGNPSGKPAFEFTPIPYTMVAGPSGTPIAISSYEDQPVLADEIVAVIEAESVDSAKEQISELGFQIFKTQDPGQGVKILSVRVPLGSVPAAIERVRAIAGVREVGPSGFKRLL
jgi:hypothetical protein